jgi:hypothetical protein
MRGRSAALVALVLLVTALTGGPIGADEETGPLDRFGLRQLVPTAPGGREWLATWDDGQPRAFDWAADPRDPWFDCAHGTARYTVDGQGTLTAAGDTVRMYVHDPERRTDWGENLEITVYITRVAETKRVSYSGLQIFARTNHGTIGSEDTNLCDDRGYGAKVTLDGRFEFEKETAHHRDGGNPSGAGVRPWEELPRDVPVGVKFVLRNMAGGTQVKLELYRDLTDGAGGGTWVKMVEMVDTGHNFGVGAAACKPGVAPELPLIRSLLLPDSESGHPTMSVYFRHEYATMRYRRASIREIAPLP